ncbi:MAG: aminotransferase class IV [Phycisphaerales bacterium]
MIVYLNGSYVDQSQAKVGVFDRGFLLGDGIYEGLRAVGGEVVDFDRHVVRMRDGMSVARMDGFDPVSLEPIFRELLAKNALRDAFLYVQVTRGEPGESGPRRARVLEGGRGPTVFVYAEPIEMIDEPRRVRACVIEDRRWTYGHVKSISLMGGVIAAFEARDRGADDAILVRDGFLTEASSTNVFVRTNGEIATPPVEKGYLLGGVTRDVLVERTPGVVVRPVSEAELRGADEIVLTGSKTMVASVVELDGEPVNGGEIGPAARKLLAALLGGVTQGVHSGDG